MGGCRRLGVHSKKGLKVFGSLENLNEGTLLFHVLDPANPPLLFLEEARALPPHFLSQFSFFSFSNNLFNSIPLSFSEAAEVAKLGVDVLQPLVSYLQQKETEQQQQQQQQQRRSTLSTSIADTSSITASSSSSSSSSSSFNNKFYDEYSCLCVLPLNPHSAQRPAADWNALVGGCGGFAAAGAAAGAAAAGAALEVFVEGSKVAAAALQQQIHNHMLSFLGPHWVSLCKLPAAHVWPGGALDGDRDIIDLEGITHLITAYWNEVFEQTVVDPQLVHHLQTYVIRWATQDLSFFDAAYVLSFLKVAAALLRAFGADEGVSRLEAAAAAAAAAAALTTAMAAVGATARVPIAGATARVPIAAAVAIAATAAAVAITAAAAAVAIAAAAAAAAVAAAAAAVAIAAEAAVVAIAAAAAPTAVAAAAATAVGAAAEAAAAAAAAAGDKAAVAAAAAAAAATGDS
ncbi:Chromosome III, complete sequence, related [Eimeria tenella]|uniref:Chromosome III, complete sequence, related n=1 Tax=Eimeria tenella TaxID=5802 RepID=U6KSB8_EIMTE|nr:Chromosome III, complete sequence, related [Eimeria tenella]CDJ40987.1 Chromosome III, complete sequence, related [Eimeria tenella]|eukprot:XP_013231737.1 Chromosome III, complete sequence, related [Eimeria tenella]